MSLTDRAEPMFLMRRLLVDAGGYSEKRLLAKYGANIATELGSARKRLTDGGVPLAGIEARIRYAWIRQRLAGCITRPDRRVATWTDRIDRVLTHRVFGTLIFLAVMFCVFTAIFMIADPAIEGEEGILLLRWLRRQERNPNRFMPIILISGHSTPTLVRRSRDCGANFFVAKPLTPHTLLERILWVARDKRPFVEVGEYLGPDRRFKELAPPGGAGRRVSDSEVTVSDDE